jgi:hypothetical protein
LGFRSSPFNFPVSAGKARQMPIEFAEFYSTEQRKLKKNRHGAARKSQGEVSVWL